MSDSSAAFWKSLAIFLLVLLLGVYVLYEWYDDQLYKQLAEKDAQIEQAQQKVKEAQSQRLDSEQGETQLRAEMERLKKEFDEEKQRLEAQLAEREHDKDDLAKAMSALKQTDAAQLAAAQQSTNDIAVERDQLAARLADAEARYQEALAKSDALQADLDRVQQAIADSAAEHRTKIAELERHLNERLELARTTPLDQELLRTAQEVGVLPVVEAFEQECKTVGGELTSSKEELEAMKQDYALMQEQLADAQEHLSRLKSELEAGQGAADSVEGQQGGDAGALAKEVTTLEDRLAAEGKVREALLRQHQAAIVALEERLASTRAKLDSTAEALAESRSGTQDAAENGGAALSASQDRVHSLESSIEALRAESEEMQSSLREEIAALKQQLADAIAGAQASDGGSEGTEPVSDDALAEAKARIAALADELKGMREQLAAAQDSDSELARMRALNAGFAKLKGTHTDRGLLLRLAESELRFQPGQASLPAGQLTSLDQIAELLNAQPKLSVRIEGHTDSRGTDALNLELSRKRAEAVRQALIERGVDADRLEVEGVGPARPIADNATAAGRSKNRRVEVYILDQEQA